jgi:formate dehydrogenase major subunit
VVHTDTPKIREARKFVLALIFSERNHFCMYCQMSNGDCELQNAAYREGMTHWPLQPNWQPYPVDASNKHFVLDHNRCILCRRCVRACGELTGNFTLGVLERGANSMLAADLDVPLGESTCVSCGNCVQVCPTGALIDRLSAYRGRQADAEEIKSTCLGCSLGCGVKLVVRDNQLLRIDGDWDAPLNEGVLCEVGRFSPLTEDRQRIVTPMVRKNGSFKAATWDEAMAFVSAKLKPLSGKNGNGVAALASTRLPVEALHSFKQLFADGLGSAMVTSIEEGVTTALPGAVAQDLGRPFEGSLEALKSADCVVAVGVDLVANHQVAGFFVKRALPIGTKLVVIDPYENGLHELAHYPLQPQKGTDYDLLLGIMSGIVSLGLAKVEPKNAHELHQHTPEIVSQTTGIPAETIRNVARLIASSQSPVFVYGKGITHGDSPEALKALIELARLAGAPEALVGVKGQANSLAAYMVGLDKPFEVNGQQAIYLALGDDKPSQRLIKRLEGAPFVAVQASHVSPVTAMADVVLPVEMWAEQEGHYLNLEGRLQEAHRGVTPSPEVRSHVAVLQSLAESLGVGLDPDWKSELRRRVPINTKE